MSNNLVVWFKAPSVNQITQKARSVPILNPFDKYGRVFFFSWLGFMIAFLSWYAFPPLLTITIRKDLHMTQNDVANSNIVALLATLLVRFLAGPLCDRFGPRYVFAGALLCGAVPTAMAGLVENPRGLIALRFFVGILGGTFVPCQVWCTAFFDRNVVGTANGLAGGWGNAGGGITYFVMPAIFDSLVRTGGLSDHVAWRVAYIVPFVLIVSVALGMLLLCEDTPSGKWSQRHIIIQGQSLSPTPESDESNSAGKGPALSKENSSAEDVGHRLAEALETAGAEIAAAPTFRGIMTIISSPHSLALAGPYACSFGSELAINSVIGQYYEKNFPELGQTRSGNWAAMFGLLNIVFRPLGGVVGDIIYRKTGSVWAKKVWMSLLGILMGAFQLAIGLSNPRVKATMFGLFSGLAFFTFAANGSTFAVVPHVQPSANGLLSGFVGACGNLGGIIFAVIFRYNGDSYNRSLWIIGAVSIGLNLAVAWIRPIPKGQVGGR